MTFHDKTASFSRASLGWGRFLPLATLALLALTPQSRAQAGFSTGTVRGNVTDTQGALVPNAKVTITNLEKGTVRTETTSGEGSYQAASLIPGTYKVEVQAEGFQKVLAEQLTVSVGETVEYDAHLTVGSSDQTVEVRGNSAPLIDATQAQQANTIDSVQQANLPNLSRNFAQQIYTLPGVSNSNAPSVQDPALGTGYQSSGFSIGGGNGRSNLFTIDGGENDFGTGGPRVAHVPQDSVQEFQVNRNSFGPEFGFTVGSAINVVTRSGTNQFHGKGFGYFHGRNTDAVNYFNSFGPTAGTKPFEQAVQYGGSVGGPIKRDKLFFFTSYEGQKLDSAVTTSLVNTAAAQGLAGQSNNFTGSSCPAPVTQACYLAQLANAGGTLGGLGGALLTSPIFTPINDPHYRALISPNDGTFDGNASNGAVQAAPNQNGRYNNWVSRLDYQPSQANSYLLRFSLSRESNKVLGPGGIPRYTSILQDIRDYTITGAWNHIAGPNLVNTVRVQVVPFNSSKNQAAHPGGAEIDLGSLGIQGTPFDFPYNQNQNQYQLDDDLSITKGTHNLKFGESYRPVQYDIFQAFLFGGQYTYLDGAVPIIGLVPTALQGALAGFNIASGYAPTGPTSTNLSASQLYVVGLPLVITQGAGNGQYNALTNPVGFYAQDSWKATQNLTLNYGGRVDIDPKTDNYPFSVFGSPRVGAAWNPYGNGKTVVRGGFGLFTAPTPFIIPFTSTNLNGNGQHVYAVTVAPTATGLAQLGALGTAERSIATAADPNPALPLSAFSSVGVNVVPPGPAQNNGAFFSVDPDFKSQYSIQTSASVAQELAPNLSLEVGYLFYRGIHVQQIQEGNFVQNPALPVDPFIGPQYMPRPGSTFGEPNTQIVQNNVTTSAGNSTYNALTASLTKRYGRGLQFQANYTFSKAIDNTSDFSSQSTPFRPGLLARDRAVSSFNVPQAFVANAVYTSPLYHSGDSLVRKLGADWVLAPIVSLQSGNPFTLLVPGLASNGTGGAHTSEARPYNEPRNSGRGPGFESFDMRISRAIPLHTESVKLNGIAQSTNILNRTNFAAVQNIFPNTATTDPVTGLTTSALVPTPRGTVDLLNGPWNYKGYRPSSAADLTNPLAFRASGLPRQISFGLELLF